MTALTLNIVSSCTFLRQNAVSVPHIVRRDRGGSRGYVRQCFDPFDKIDNLKVGILHGRADVGVAHEQSLSVRSDLGQSQQGTERVPRGGIQVEDSSVIVLQ